MRVSTLAALVGSVALAAVLWILLKDDGGGPEAQVRRALAEAVEAAEAGDVGGVLDRVAEDFSGRGLDRRMLTGLLFRELRRGDWRQVVLHGTEISVASDTLVDVRTRAVLARGEGVVPVDADTWALELTWVRDPDDGAWRVTHADWRPASAP